MKYSSLFSQLSLCLKNRDNSLCSSNLQKNTSGLTKSGFTLVELIVVITILAILALVAFLMMSDATVSARDSNRLASIKNIYDASQLQAVQQRLLPLPDQAITLSVSGTDIGWQGYMSGYVAQAYGYSDSVYDPRDNTPYIYRVNQTRNKSQYLAYLENGGSISQGDILLAFGGMDGIERIGGVKEFKSFAGLEGLAGFGIDTAQATDFSKRVPYVYGDRLGVVLSNTTNEGANVALGSGGTLDLGGGSIDSNYSVYVNEGLKLASVEGTGAVALKTNGGLDDLIANATIVASSGSNSGSGSSACGLTQGEVDAMNTAFGLAQIAQEWCDTTYLNINGQLINTTALSGIMKLINLTDLTLEDASISNIPSSIGNLVNLSYLNLNGNTFSSIPESIGNLTNLYSLNLAWNSNLINLPDSLGNLTNLGYLDLQGSNLGTLTTLFEAGSNNTQSELSITPLGQEVHIIASGSPTIQIIVGAVPPPSCGLIQDEIDILNSTESTNLTGQEWCDITQLELIEQFGNDPVLLGAIGKLTNLQILALSDSSLNSFPTEILALTGLTSLDLRNNNISSLPPGIGNLTNLTWLDLGTNSITSLPIEIGDLVNLSYLNLDDNDLDSLPNEIENLATLDSLNINNNQFTVFPAIVENLIGLQILKIAGNQLTTLPFTIESIVALEELNLDNNFLTSLPEEIGNLNNLHILDVGYNSLTTLPDNFSGLDDQLERLNLDGNTSLGTIAHNFDIVYNWVTGTFSESSITPTGGDITITSPNGNNRISISVTP